MHIISLNVLITTPKMVGRFIHGRGCINMKPETEHLLSFIIGYEDYDTWINGYNKAFDMSPQEMIDLGREDEVVSYLKWAVYGPY
jgi:hypothetical protein